MKSGRQGPADLAGRDNSGRFFTRRGLKSGGTCQKWVEKRKEERSLGRILHQVSKPRGQLEEEEDHFVIRLTSD